MIILAILVFGMLVGAVAHFIVGDRGRTDWRSSLLVGIAGSFVGGLGVSLAAGDGLALRPSGAIASVIGATLLLLTFQLLR